MNYLKVDPKKLSKHGKKVKGTLYLNEGVYCLYAPNLTTENINPK